MKLRELIRYSKTLLKNKRISTMIICLLPFLPEIFFRFAEVTVYSLLLYFGDMKPLSLFSGENPLQVTISVFSFILRLFTTAPLIYISAFRLCEICYDSTRKSFTPVSEILINGRNFRRSLAVSLWTEFIGLIALIPAGLAGITAYYFIMNTDDVFVIVQTIVLTIVSLFLWLNVRITLFAVPFLMAHFPHKSVFRLVFHSFKFMRGRRTDILKLFTAYSFPLLTVISAPYFLPEMMTAFALSISIYVREDDYSERIKINCNFNKSGNTSKVPHRKRRFTAFVDQTEASGFGNNL
ncbi:MAG: hypothetical protein K2H26_03905 [Ruminococcus sp.]|nr:hypothetical protein [Ruminococcus sp.]